MKHHLLITALLALLLVPAAAVAQTSSVVEVGVGGVTGTVDNRTGAGGQPFSNGFRPDLVNAGVNTYDDYRNRLAIPRIAIETALPNNQYFSLDAVNSGLAFNGGVGVRNQAYAATVSRPGGYQVRFQYDETPHLFSGTTRTLYRETSPGVWQFTGDRAALNAARVAGTGAAFAAAVPSQVAGATPFVQEATRKTVAGSASFAIRPAWDLALSFARENQAGTRPHGMCFGNSPSCVWSEVPENIDYNTSTFAAKTEFGSSGIDLAMGYWRQAFENKVGSLIADNPFSTVYTGSATATGQLGLYPSNDAQNLQFAGAVHKGAFHFMTSISPGWMSQNEPFVPYTTNTFLLGRTGSAAPIPLPASSLEGERKTLAMNFTASYKPAQRLEVSAKYRQYDFNNHTPEERVFNPWVNDLEAEAQLFTPGGSGQETIEFAGIGGVVNTHCRGVCPEYLSFSTKAMDLGGTWFFAGRNSAKVQYGREWFDRENRDVRQTIEDTIRGAVDLKPTADLTVRLSASRQDRRPQDAEYEWFLIPGTQRPDEGFRLRHRVDLLAQYDLTDRVSVSGFYGERNDDFNRQSPLTSMTPLGDPAKIARIGSASPTPILGNYYVYGVLDDKNRTYGADVDVLVAGNVTLFAEYARERNSLSQVSRARSANTASQKGCPSTITPQDCDPINDWTTSSKDLVNTYTVGLDMRLTKAADVSVYFTRSDADGSMLSDGVNCQVGSGGNAACRTSFPNWRLDSAASPAVTFNFPDTASRIQEVNAIVGFRLTDALRPKFRYRFQQFDYNDFQTSVMNPFSYVGPKVDPGGTTGLQRMIFLGADTPGYRAHIFSLTVEYRF